MVIELVSPVANEPKVSVLPAKYSSLQPVCHDEAWHLLNRWRWLAPPSALRLTHIITVKFEAPKSSVEALATLTASLTPSKLSAAPYCPVAHAGPLTSVAVCPLPDRSAD